MITKEDFICKNCGNCCGFKVLLRDTDIKTIEDVGYTDFYETDNHGDRYLRTDKDGCIFLGFKEGKSFCKIYNIRPDTCRLYPFNEKEEVEDCRQ